MTINSVQRSADCRSSQNLPQDIYQAGQALARANRSWLARAVNAARTTGKLQYGPAPETGRHQGGHSMCRRIAVGEITKLRRAPTACWKPPIRSTPPGILCIRMTRNGLASTASAICSHKSLTRTFREKNSRYLSDPRKAHTTMTPS